MISAAQIKYIRSLQLKKYRDFHQAFVAEGEKIVGELLMSSLIVDTVCSLPSWMESHGHLIGKGIEPIVVSEKELRRISGQKNPGRVLAVGKKPLVAETGSESPGNIALLLDGLQDPGNLGTILRTADWFGIGEVFCSPGSADVYNPKVIQASMGSFIRVRVNCTPLPELLDKMDRNRTIYGACPGGENLFSASVSLPAALVIGNESRGISAGVDKRIHHRLSIPPAGQPAVEQGPESLNAAMAAGIMIAWLRHGKQGS